MTNDERAKFVDLEIQMRDALYELLANKVSGEITAEEFQRELDIAKAMTALCGLTAEVAGQEGPLPQETIQREQAILTRQQKIIALWSEACRRAEVPVMDYPLASCGFSLA